MLENHLAIDPPLRPVSPPPFEEWAQENLHRFDTAAAARDYVRAYAEFDLVVEQAMKIPHTYMDKQQINRLFDDMTDADSPLLDEWCRAWVDHPMNRCSYESWLESGDAMQSTYNEERTRYNAEF